MKKLTNILLISLAIILAISFSCKKIENLENVVIQLNWLHDPTFAGEYLMSQISEIPLLIREGGTNISPISEVLSGNATAAVVGADIFLQTIDNDIRKGEQSELICFYIDFQRNPVGWILHPEVATKEGLTSNIQENQKQLNDWLFSKFLDGTIRPGDKRGTETTSIWIQWKKLHSLPDNIKVIPVGFDSGIVLSAPMLAYPVYLNEEPFKLSEKIGRNVVIFDPVADGVVLYGNVLVTTKKNIQLYESTIMNLRQDLTSSWKRVEMNRNEAVNEVARFYKGVSKQVLKNQIDKTIEFVFFKVENAGEMDITPGGMWENTLNALQESGVVSQDLSLEMLKEYLYYK